MIRIVDTFAQLEDLFPNGQFCLKKWEAYVNAVYDGCANLFMDDMKACLASGRFTYERDVLPVIQAVWGHPAAGRLHASFCRVTQGLNKKVAACFGREVEADIVLYLGLCNGAGWVTEIRGRQVILLGIEKILELNWQDEQAMYGLIYHELGHVYHSQFGMLPTEENQSCFVWQLFSEGIAMYFEQVLVGDMQFYHQNKNGWLAWCETHYLHILRDFSHDLPAMNRQNQRYFGDWVNYNGWGDVGYYLGARFVQFLCRKIRFDCLIEMEQAQVCRLFSDFVSETICG